MSAAFAGGPRWHARKALLVGCIVLYLGTAAPALAQAVSLTITTNHKPTVGQALGITVEGTADGTARLFVYADFSGHSCASNPNNEYNQPSVVALSSVTGDSLATGSYSKGYSYTPAVERFRICGYLDDTSTGVPDVSEGDVLGEGELPTGTWSGPPVVGSSEPPHGVIETAAEYYERLAREQAAQKAAQPIVHCVVPSLKGDSLSRAKQVLLHANCKLGKVHKHRGAHGTLVVTGQSPAHGKRLAQGAAIGVALGARKR
jgi:hypothetical protein